MGWTDERVDLLKQLWTEGLSASQIADRLGGVSRNAVIGKVHRLKLESRGKSAVVETKAAEPQTLVPEMPKEIKTVVEPRVEYVETVEAVAPARLVASVAGSMPRHMPRTVGATALKFQPDEDLLIEEEAVVEERQSGEVVPISRKLTLIQLTDRTCKWPIGDPLHEDFHFCGNGSSDTSPYCAFHNKLAFQAVERRRMR